MSWKNPPPVVAMGGTETYLRDRQIRNAILVTARSGRAIVHAETDSDVVDALTMAGTFGEAALILIPIKAVQLQTVQEHLENPAPKTCILVIVDGAMDEAKFPVLKEIHGAYQIAHARPSKKKELLEQAIRFAVIEAGSLLKNKKALDKKLATALVKGVGSDLGIVAHELSKMAALARSEGVDEISLAHVKSLIKPSSDIDMGPLREALKNRDGRRVSASLDRLRRNAPEEPVMLLLRARGGPADLVLTWFRAAILLERGAGEDEIAARLSVPPWAAKRDIVPAARRWGVEPLRELITNLANADRGVLRGAPSPWVSIETALLLGCVG
jgi:DNA polymerase III delta subunit